MLVAGEEARLGQQLRREGEEAEGQEQGGQQGSEETEREDRRLALGKGLSKDSMKLKL
jgi:hypothetical protein